MKLQYVSCVLILLFLLSCTKTAEYRNHENTGFRQGGNDDARADETTIFNPEPAEEDEEEKKQKSDKLDEVTNWKPSEILPNSTRVSIGDSETLPLEGTQIAVQIDGFRARVLIDCFYKNDRNFQAEGTFKLRLPNGASPYFFAFGETEYLNHEKNIGKIPFFEYKKDTRFQFSPKDIMKMRMPTWTQPKEARMVPKEKAALAYTRTVKRRVDPALMEWEGADQFSARVFPLAPNKVHRIVVGYEVELSEAAGNRNFTLPIPESKTPLVVDMQINKEDGLKPTVFGEGIDVHETSKYMSFHVRNPKTEAIEVTYQNSKNILLTSQAQEIPFFAASFTPKLPANTLITEGEDAIFLLDVSASSNTDKFHIWLRLIIDILKQNEDRIRRFKVLCFNIEQFWWKEGFAENISNNRIRFQEFANTLALEGATDLGAALQHIKQSGDKPDKLYLISDGAATWGPSDLHTLSHALPPSTPLYAFHTGLSGTNNRILSQLTRESGGTILYVRNQSEIRKASMAVRTAAWEIKNISFSGASDILMAGAPQFIYPDQPLIITGRGTPSKSSKLTLTVAQNGKERKVNIPITHAIRSTLTPRVYGQIATEQLETFGYDAETDAQAYATHFRIPGKTCSLLMLESEADYQEYDIKPEDNLSHIKKNTVTALIKAFKESLKGQLGVPKIAFIKWVERLQKMPGLSFTLTQELKELMEGTPQQAFTIDAPAPLGCKIRQSKFIPESLTKEITKAAPSYDIIVREAHKRKAEGKLSDALKCLSSLVERNPNDGVLIRDVGYSAREWGMSEQAYYLFRRVVENRPFEPQTYHALASILTDMEKVELAIFYYELALAGEWRGQLQDFKTIVGLDYLMLLQDIKNKKQNVSFPSFAEQRIVSLRDTYIKEEPDLMITIAWNTDATDIDLHVIEPSGEKCFYKNKKTRSGGKITQDVTQGYGPEMYIQPKMQKGKYKIKADFFRSNPNRASARTKVYATIYQHLGKPNAKVLRKVVTLQEDKKMQNIAVLEIPK